LFQLDGILFGFLLLYSLSFFQSAAIPGGRNSISPSPPSAVRKPAIGNAPRVISHFKDPQTQIFCDPEIFTGDTQETMSQYGMGVLYEKSDEGEVIRRVTPKLKEKTRAKRCCFYQWHPRRTAAWRGKVEKVWEMVDDIRYWIFLGPARQRPR
jgi:hypothetical protein